MPEGYEHLPGDGGENGGRVTYYYVAHGQPAARSHQHHQQQQGYGTNDGMRVERPNKAQRNDAEEQGQGSSAAAVPPSYEQAVKGDHKVQT